MKILGLERIKNFIKENIFLVLYYSLMFLSIILLLCKVPLAIYAILILLGYGWSLFFLKKKVNVLEHFFLSFGIIATILIVFSIIFAFFSLKLNLYVGIFFFVLSNVFFLLFKVFRKENINLKISKYDYFILILFIGAFIAKVLSVRSFEVPGLHDPITHAFFSKRIVDTGLIEYFYSPGLHILGAFSNIFNGFDVARQILYITNLFNAYIGVAVYMYVKHTFKKSSVWALGSALLFSLWYYPATFFVNAGKNALVLALVFLFLFMFLVQKYRESHDKGILVVANIVLVSIFLTHYPTAIWACTYLLAIFFVDFKKEKFKTILLGLGIFLGLGWMLKTYGYNVLAVSESAVASSGSLFTIPSNILQAMVNFLKAIWGTVNFKDAISVKLTAILSVLGFGVMAVKSFTKKKDRTLILWFVFTVLVSFPLNTFSIKPLLIILETFWISLFMFSYLFSGFFVSYIYNLVDNLFKKKFTKILKTVFLASFLILTVLFSIKMYRTFYERNSMHDVVQESDIKSFDWINENIPDEEKFLINANGNDGLVFSTDGGGWLEVFTDNEISMPFYDYGSKKTDDNVDLYYELKENLGSCDFVNTFVDRGYRYYFQGSRPVFDKWLGEKEQLLESGRFELLYENGNSEVYRLIPCAE